MSHKPGVLVLLNQEEYLESTRKANANFMESIRKDAFPTPSPMGIERELQQVTEAYAMIARWSQGRKNDGYELKIFKEEVLGIISAVLKVT